MPRDRGCRARHRVRRPAAVTPRLHRGPHHSGRRHRLRYGAGQEDGRVRTGLSLVATGEAGSTRTRKRERPAPGSGRADLPRGGSEDWPHGQPFLPQLTVTVCGTFSAALALVEVADAGLLNRTYAYWL